MEIASTVISTGAAAPYLVLLVFLLLALFALYLGGSSFVAGLSVVLAVGATIAYGNYDENQKTSIEEMAISLGITNVEEGVLTIPDDGQSITIGGVTVKDADGETSTLEEVAIVRDDKKVSLISPIVN